MVGEERRQGVDDLDRTGARGQLAASHRMIMATIIILSNGMVVRAYQILPRTLPLVDGVWIVAVIGSKLGDKWYCVSSRAAAILRASRRGKRYRIRRLHQGFRYRQRWLRSPRSDACSFGTLRCVRRTFERGQRLSWFAIAGSGTCSPLPPRSNPAGPRSISSLTRTGRADDQPKASPAAPFNSRRGRPARAGPYETGPSGVTARR